MIPFQSRVGANEGQKPISSDDVIIGANIPAKQKFSAAGGGEVHDPSTDTELFPSIFVPI
jgi:hypothetical protein